MANSSEQKFCRACGLDLEDAKRSLIEQLPAAIQNQRLSIRRQKVERLLHVLAGVGITAFAVILISTIITEIIIGKGQLLGGIVFIAFFLGIVLFLLLVLYGESLKKATGDRKLPDVETPRMDTPPTRQLSDPYFEPVPGVTESTTELLSAEIKSNKQS
jgi:hypothetical protein